MAHNENLNKKVIDEVYLRDYKEFVKIDNKYYGGSQYWLYKGKYISKFRSNRSCGAVVASNVFHHMAKDNKKIKLVGDPSNLSKKEFLEYTMLVYKFIKPRFYGIPTVNLMKKRLERFTESIKLEIKFHQLINPSNKLKTINFIKKAMKKNIPIMMLTLNTKTENLKYHWVTITGYYKIASGENFIVTSNWGKKEVFSLDKWLNNKSLYKGLLYFELNNKK